MSCCFIVASSDDRKYLLEKCIRAYQRSRYSETPIYLFYQGSKFHEVVGKEIFTEVIIDPHLRGIFTPRYELMKRFCMQYDFTILIDDDLFLYPYTSYDTSMAFMNANPLCGATSIGRQGNKIKNEMYNKSAHLKHFNVDGGMVFPRKSIEIILDYFKDKEDDYTEDMVWLLLYIKGYDLYKDYSSKAVHLLNQKTENKEYSGYTKMRLEKPYKPIFTEWFKARREYDSRFGCEIWSIKELYDINERGKLERTINRAKRETEKRNQSGAV